MAPVTVTNHHQAPVERAGIVFPARRATVVSVPDDGLEAIASSRHLTIEEAPPDLARYTVPQLQRVARDSRLDTSGRKAELLARLDPRQFPPHVEASRPDGPGGGKEETGGDPQADGTPTPLAADVGGEDENGEGPAEGG